MFQIKYRQKMEIMNTSDCEKKYSLMQSNLKMGQFIRTSKERLKMTLTSRMLTIKLPLAKNEQLSNKDTCNYRKNNWGCLMKKNKLLV
jgi:hypothetical protein